MERPKTSTIIGKGYGMHDSIEFTVVPSHIFRELLKWHQERFGESHQGTRLSGALLEIPEDKAAWRAACDEGI